MVNPIQTHLRSLARSGRAATATAGDYGSSWVRRRRGRRVPARRGGYGIVPRVKVGIVVPFSWSFWGAVVEHAELQAAALEALGCDVRLIAGNDPPGQFTRVLHPRAGRHGEPPTNVIQIGRSVMVPANGTLPNIILSPRS